jgi:hypothetical protein
VPAEAVNGVDGVIVGSGVSVLTGATVGEGLVGVTDRAVGVTGAAGDAVGVGIDAQAATKPTVRMLPMI